MSTTSSRNFTTLYSGSGSVVPQGAYGNANVVSLLNVGTDGGNTVSNIVATGNISTTAQISAQGNITTAGYFVGSLVGNVSGNVTAAGSNTQVQFNNNGLLGADGDFTYNNSTNALAVTGNITGGNVAGTTVTATTVLATTVSATTVNATANVAGGNITTVGQVSATGNITAPYFIGNIVGNIDAGGSNTQVQFNDGDLLAGSAGFTFDKTTNAAVVAGNITGSNINTGGVVSATGNVQGGNIRTTGTISATGNIITDGYFLGNVANASGIFASRIFNGTSEANIGTSGGNANITIGGTSNVVVVSTTGVSVAGIITATGNVTGGNVVVPNGSRYRGDFTAGGTAGRSFFQTTDTNTNAATFVSAIPGPNHVATPGTIGSATGLFSTNDAGNASIFGMYSYPTDASIRSLSTGTGNINDVTFRFGLAGTLAATITQGGNITAVANLSSTQQTVIGTANAGSTGNIVMSGRNIATDMAYQPDGQTSPALYYGRTMVGTGFNGNINLGTSSRLASWDSITRSSTATQVRQIDAETQVSLTGNVTNASFRQQGIGARVRVGGGPSANTVAMPNSTGTPTALVALQPNMDIGNSSPYNLGNTTVSHVALNGGFITVNSGSTVGNAYGFIPGAVGPVSNYIGLTNNLNAAVVTGNLYMVYNPSSATLTTTGLATSNNARAATNYYFLRNDDDVAQVKLGSLRNYNEFQYATATSGTVNIDKNNAQVQFIAPTANVTIGDFQNFVTNANDGTNNDAQTDTVTLVIQQGATPYTVTMPTGNSSIKYAGGISTVGNAANAVTMVSISAFRSTGNAAIYLTTVSPEFV